MQLTAVRCSTHANLVIESRMKQCRIAKGMPIHAQTLLVAEYSQHGTTRHHLDNSRGWLVIDNDKWMSRLDHGGA